MKLLDKIKRLWMYFWYEYELEEYIIEYRSIARESCGESILNAIWWGHDIRHVRKSVLKAMEHRAAKLNTERFAVDECRDKVNSRTR